MQGSEQGAGGRALDISAMMARHSGLGALVGARLDSSTADVYRSSVRKAASSSPNCCSNTSPWSAPQISDFDSQSIGRYAEYGLVVATQQLRLM